MVAVKVGSSMSRGGEVAMQFHRGEGGTVRQGHAQGVKMWVGGWTSVQGGCGVIVAGG